MTNLIKEYLQIYLQGVVSGERELSPETIAFFGAEAASSITRQFSNERAHEKWRPRMSGLGKPLCQQQLERDGIAVKKKMDYNSVNRFLFGDLLETLMYIEMKEAGINVEAYQEKVSITVAGIKVNGTLDVIIDGKVWDIKTSSPYAYMNKFSNYNKVKDNDPFGYVLQGYLYAAAVDKPFGGWIVMNKSSGEVLVCNAPSIQDEESKAALATAAYNMTVLQDPTIKVQKLDDEPEMYKKEKTGTIHLQQ